MAPVVGAPEKVAHEVAIPLLLAPEVEATELDAQDDGKLG